VGKISSPERIASVPNLCNGRCQWAGNMGNEECCSGFGERVCQFISGKSSMTGSLELHGRRGSRKDPISEGLWLEKRWGPGEKGKGRLGVS